jgi:hypothetical protein
MCWTRTRRKCIAGCAEDAGEREGNARVAEVVECELTCERGLRQFPSAFERGRRLMKESQAIRKAKYSIRFFFEWGGGCLWPGDDVVYQEFGLGPYDLLDPCPLPLLAPTLTKCRELADWHDTSLNMDYPPDPSPWDSTESGRFNDAAKELLAIIRLELGPDYHVLDKQCEAGENAETTGAVE